MKYEKQEIMQYIAEEDVKFIRLAFADARGRQKNISVLPTELEGAFSAGQPFDAAQIEGFYGEDELFLRPDPDTLTVLPWRPEHGRVVRMFCTVKRQDGSPYPGDPRRLLSLAEAAAKERGLTFTFSTHANFYLFCTDEKGDPTKTPYDTAGYLDIAPEDKGENVRREICLTLEKMGISPKSSRHMAGPGQNEIDFEAASPLRAADNAMAFSTVVKVVAAKNGLYADFSPKPLKSCVGNGLGISMDVRTATGERFNREAYFAICRRLSELSAFLNPLEGSYSRIREELNGSDNIIRRDREGRIHLLSPDSGANPYIALALLIYAVLEGEDGACDIPSLHETLAAAKEDGRNSEFVKKYLPREIGSIYLED